MAHWDAMELASLMEHPAFWTYWFGLATPDLFTKISQALLTASKQDPDLSLYIQEVGAHTLGVHTLGMQVPWQHDAPCAILSTTPWGPDQRADQAAQQALVATEEAVAKTKSIGAMEVVSALWLAMEQLEVITKTATEPDLQIQGVVSKTERAAADALALLDNAFAKTPEAEADAKESVRQAQKGAQDFLILACTRSLAVAEAELKTQGNTRVPASKTLRGVPTGGHRASGPVEPTRQR